MKPISRSWNRGLVAHEFLHNGLLRRALTRRSFIYIIRMTNEQPVYLRSDARRALFGQGRVMGTRMRVPGYPSNREADEGAMEATAMSGKVRHEDEAKPGDLFTP